MRLLLHIRFTFKNVLVHRGSIPNLYLAFILRDYDELVALVQHILRVGIEQRLISTHYSDGSRMRKPQIYTLERNSFPERIVHHINLIPFEAKQLGKYLGHARMPS